MADLSYNTKVYLKQGGEELVVASGGAITVESGGTITVGGTDLIAELAALDGLDATELGYLNGVSAGTATASKAAVLGATKNLDELSINPGGMKSDGVVVSPMKWVDVAVTAALLDAAGTANVIAGVAGDQYKVREVVLVGGGTNFGAGGDRNISLTDGTTVWTTIANADIEAAPTASLRWGDAKVPFLTDTSSTASVAGQAIRFAYSGGTTDHGGTGSITFSVCLEKVA